MTQITLNVNGRQLTDMVEPRTHLADFLREQLDLTGTHLRCEQGACGACTILIDGQPARSCITYAVACDGARVRTIEGFDDDALMGHLRQAFTEGERWPVSPKRIDRLVKAGLIMPEQAEQFRSNGALGSHLENLERNDGFKGFNQTGVSEIISATDPRRHLRR